MTARAWYVMLVSPSGMASIMRVVGECIKRMRGDAIVFYMPQVVRFQHDKRRTHNYKVVNGPLLPGYVFVSIPAGSDAFYLLSEFEGVFGFIKDGGLPAVLPDFIISYLADREKAGEFDQTKHRRGRIRSDLAPFPDWLREDGDVRITAGPFAGFVATVREAVSLLDIKVEVSLLGKPTRLQLPLDDVRNL